MQSDKDDPNVAAGVAKQQSDEVPAYLSTLDSDRFGIRVARSPHITALSLSKVNALCAEMDIALLIARCPSTDAVTVSSLESAGFRLMETLVSWRRAFPIESVPACSTRTSVRELGGVDSTQLATIAQDAFNIYHGHYHTDGRLPHATCVEVYRSWASRCVAEPGVADVVLGAEEDGTLLGFIALKRQDKRMFDVPLTAVATAAQGRGVFGALLSNALKHCAAQGAQALDYSCTLTNVAAQKRLVRLGFEIQRASYTFHKWFI